VDTAFRVQWFPVFFCFCLHVQGFHQQLLRRGHHGMARHLFEKYPEMAVYLAIGIGY
jgi:hypothetical protein